jgi:hypothetical protein
MLNPTDEEWMEMLDGDGVVACRLYSLARTNEEIGLRICRLAGLLARSDEYYRAVLKEEIKRAPAWTELELMGLWCLYSISLER